MSSYQESVIIPKVEFLKLLEASPSQAAITVEDNNSNVLTNPPPSIENKTPIKDEATTVQIGSGRHKRKSSHRKRKIIKSPNRHNFYEDDPEFLKFLQSYRKPSYKPNGYIPIQPSSIISATATATPTTSNRNMLINMFPPEYSYKINRILHYMEQNPNILTYNPKTMELIAFNRTYPESNIVEILSYLTGMNNHKTWVSENEYMYSVAGVHIPKDSEVFMQALQHILGTTKEEALSTLLDSRKIIELKRTLKLVPSSTVEEFKRLKQKNTDLYIESNKDLISKKQEKKNLISSIEADISLINNIAAGNIISAKNKMQQELNNLESEYKEKLSEMESEYQQEKNQLEEIFKSKSSVLSELDSETDEHKQMMKELQVITSDMNELSEDLSKKQKYYTDQFKLKKQQIIDHNQKVISEIESQKDLDIEKAEKRKLSSYLTEEPYIPESYYDKPHKNFKEYLYQTKPKTSDHLQQKT